MFRDREDAGKQLADLLKPYKDEDVIVLSIPRGGAEIGYWVAKELRAPHKAIVVRKLPLPHKPEAGFGAIAEDGSTYMQEGHEDWLSSEEIKRVKKEQQEEIKRRVQKLREGEPLPSLKGRTVILVDDGIAMGSTMIAAIKACSNLGAKRIIAASPVSSREVGLVIAKLVDELIIIETPHNFYAVAQVYERWHDVTYEEAKKWLRES
ncbi:phosphoribosyltransferase|nr:phosphoribosyltransferase [archaeon]